MRSQEAKSLPQWDGKQREKSVIKMTQTSKPQAVAVDRLWTVHDVSAFLGVPVGTLYQGAT